MKSLTAFIITTVSIALLAFYAWPQWQTVSSLQQKNTQLKDALSNAEKLTALRNELITRYNAIPSEEMVKVGKVVPKQYDPLKLTADINALAMRYGMVVKGATFINRAEISNPGTGAVVEAQPLVSPYKVVAASFSIEGQYKDFVLLLADLEKNLQILDVTNVDITSKSAKEKSGSASLDFKITLDTYWMN